MLKFDYYYKVARQNVAAQIVLAENGQLGAVKKVPRVGPGNGEPSPARTNFTKLIREKFGDLATNEHPVVRDVIETLERDKDLPLSVMVYMI